MISFASNRENRIYWVTVKEGVPRKPEPVLTRETMKKYRAEVGKYLASKGNKEEGGAQS